MPSCNPKFYSKWMVLFSLYGRVILVLGKRPFYSIRKKIHNFPFWPFLKTELRCLELHVYHTSLEHCAICSTHFNAIWSFSVVSILWYCSKHGLKNDWGEIIEGEEKGEKRKVVFCCICLFFPFLWLWVKGWIEMRGQA